MNRAYLALGSNIDPEHNLPAAVRLLGEHGEVQRVSRVWESPPVGFAEQPNFLNAAVLLLTDLSARDLRLKAIAGIERRLGRTRDPGNRNAPRTIDIDIALFNQDVLDIDHRHIPDPDLLERDFVAVPVAELAPDYVHPETKQTLSSIAGAFRAGAPAGSLEERPDVLLTRCVLIDGEQLEGGL
jgi:2-amino-4-hydroxy-6-hydroxymethyldihydropteridine diphosphokinase